jgi:hypothetical protein
MPTKHGLGYKRVVKRKNGPALFGAWCALIQVLSRHPKPREGYCTDTGQADGRPYTDADLEMMTDIPAAIFKELFQVAAAQEVDWLRIAQYPCTDTTGDHGTIYSDSDSDSNSDSNSNPKPPGGGAVIIPDSLGTLPGFNAEWAAYLQHRKTKRAKATPHAQELILALLAERPSSAIHALQEAQRRGWTGIKWEWIDGGGQAGDSADPRQAEWKRARDEVKEAIWRAKEQQGDISATIRAARDKFGDCPKLEGVDAVQAGIDLALNNRRAG